MTIIIFGWLVACVTATREFKLRHVYPKTAKTTRLFNPRQQQWSKHFQWSSKGTQIEGKTAIGRATVNALQLNNFIAVTVREQWVQAGWHPPSN